MLPWYCTSIVPCETVNANLSDLFLKLPAQQVRKSTVKIHFVKLLVNQHILTYHLWGQVICSGLGSSSTPHKRLLGSRARVLLTGREHELSSDRLDFSKSDFWVGLSRVSCPASRPGCSSDLDFIFPGNFLESLCSGWEGSITGRAATPFPLRTSIFLKWAILCLGMNLLQKGNAICFLWKKKKSKISSLPSYKDKVTTYKTEKK